MHKKICVIFCLLLVASLLQGCFLKDGKETAQEEDKPIEKEEKKDRTAATLLPYVPREEKEEKTKEPDSSEDNLKETQIPLKPAQQKEKSEQQEISDQSFDVTLKPLGDVHFASYKPTREESAFEDVTFKILKNHETLLTLSPMAEGNIRTDAVFDSIDTIAFRDYNKDGYSDIIIICKYIDKSHTHTHTSFTETRLYRGCAEGTFSFDQILMEKINGSKDNMYYGDVMDILKKYGEGIQETQKPKKKATKSPDKEDVSWKKAYLSYLSKEDTSAYDGYNLIEINDDGVPELVEVGNCEAVGCKILNYHQGKVYETQLRRLYFSYIPKQNLLCNSEGNMDVYSDDVYSIKNGRMTKIAGGIYGAEDNTNIQLDENGEPIYTYKWNNKKVSKEKYESALHAVYDESKAVEGDCANYTLSELKSKLQ